MNRPAQANPPPSHPTRRRVFVWSVLIVAVLFVGLRLILVKGWLLPIRIAGASMADVLPGPHCCIRCRDCGFSFRCGAEFLPIGELAVCPNCGYTENPVDVRHMSPGQRVLIDRGRQAIHGNQTWSPVAFRADRGEQKLTVKRIVAAGNGTVEIRDGDVYLDGLIQQKSLAQLRQVRILVHDDRFRPSLDPKPPPRWRPTEASSGWQTTETGYAITWNQRRQGPAIDWIEYAQWTCWPNAGLALDRTEPVPIFDHYAYNQSLSRGSLHRVADVMLWCQLELRGTGRGFLRLQDGGHEFTLELEPGSRRCLLREDDVLVAEMLCEPTRQPWTVEMALCDHRVLAAVEGMGLSPHCYEPSAATHASTLPSIAVGVVGLDGQFLAPRVYRDIYYLGPGGARRWRAPKAMTPGQWFALGDNVPASVDSRLWSAMDDDAILGPVIPWGR